MWAYLHKWNVERLKSRNIALFWACLLSLACGAIALGEPLDQTMRQYRNHLRPQKASGDIVVVGIDSRSLAEVNRWPWPRANYAKIIDQLIKAGAEKIGFDISFVYKSDVNNDKMMVNSLKNSKGKVFLATRFIIDPISRKRIDKATIPEMSRYAEDVNINWRVGIFGLPKLFPYQLMVNGKYSPTMASLLSGVSGQKNEYFRADYAIDINTIPMFSAVDVLNGKISPSKFKGKNIIVAFAASETDDMYRWPGRGMTPGGYFWVAAAETLKRGKPLDIGWLTPWAIGMVVACAFMHLHKKALRRLIYASGVAGLIFGPLILDQNLIFVDVTPALLALAIVGGARIRANIRKRLHESAITNNVSGQYNLNALREVVAPEGSSLIVAKVHNFIDMKATFPPEREKDLIDQIVARIDLNRNGATLYQGDDGVFAWMAAAPNQADVQDQVDALYAIFRSPIMLDGISINVFMTFGLDNDDSRALPNRLNTALLAADEAAKLGHRWAQTDRSKSQLVETQLRLLGELDHAIANGELWVAYQPKFDLVAKRICGAEALIRWNHPHRGEISPQDFIGLAEDQNRIDNLTLFVLRDAIKAAAAVNTNGLGFEIAVNLSPRSFYDQPIDLIINTILIDNQLPPHLLTLEVTETAVMSDDGIFLEMLDKLDSIGVNISIDDFGTGQSTLSYLKLIPGNEVKIDRSLIMGIDRDEQAHNLVISTINMIHSLKKIALAEGVEDAIVLDLVTKIGFEKAQGYHIGRPMRFRDLWDVLGLAKERFVA